MLDNCSVCGSFIFGRFPLTSFSKVVLRPISGVTLLLCAMNRTQEDIPVCGYTAHRNIFHCAATQHTGISKRRRRRRKNFPRPSKPHPQCTQGQHIPQGESLTPIILHAKVIILTARMIAQVCKNTTQNTENNHRGAPRFCFRSFA